MLHPATAKNVAKALSQKVKSSDWEEVYKELGRLTESDLDTAQLCLLTDWVFYLNYLLTPEQREWMTELNKLGTAKNAHGFPIKIEWDRLWLEYFHSRFSPEDTVTHLLRFNPPATEGSQ